MAATSQSSTQQVPMIDVWKSCTLCSAVVITSLRVLESNYSLFHKSQNHLIEFTVYFTKIRFGRTFPRKTRCSWRCLDVFIQSFRVDFLYEKCVEWTVRKKNKKLCDWFVMCCLCVTCTCDFFLIYICVIQNSTVSLHVFPYVLPYVVYVNYLYCRWFCVCVCFLNILNLCQFVYAISVRAANFELLHSWFVSTKCLLHLTPLGFLEIFIISQSLKINWGLPNPQMAMRLISQPQTVSSVRSAPSPSPQVVYKMLQLGSSRIKIKENTWNLHFINCVLCAVHLAHRPKLFIKCFN